MTETALTLSNQHPVPIAGSSLAPLVPAIIADSSDDAAYRFIEFFTANIENDNTRAAYAGAARQFFDWCERRPVSLRDLTPVIVAAYFKQHTGSVPTRKQHLTALRMLFDYLVTGQVLPSNPAASVRAPRYSQRTGKTPVLTPEDARLLLDSIPTGDVVGLRDRALIGVMVYSFARVSAAINMVVKDYYANGKRHFFRLHEKGGKFHEVPAHHHAIDYLDAYLEAAGIGAEKQTPLFRSVKGGGKAKQLSPLAMDRKAVWFMIRRRAAAAGLNGDICCHTFRATGITAYLMNGGSLEHAQRIAAHSSSQTTKLYDHSDDQITLDEINLIRI